MSDVLKGERKKFCSLPPAPVRSTAEEMVQPGAMGEGHRPYSAGAGAVLAEGSCAKGRSLCSPVVLTGTMKVWDSSISNVFHSKPYPSVLQKRNGEVENNPQLNCFGISGLKPKDEVKVQTSWVGG